jgi:hypothetical protein
MLTDEILAAGDPRRISEALEQPVEAGHVYVGGGLFTDEQKAFHFGLAHELEGLGFSVFLPQRDGYEAATLSDWTDEQKIQRIYKRDLLEVCRARFLFANLDGAIPDDGVCAEVAIASVHKLLNPDKRIVGYRTDTRTFMGTLPLNPLVAGALDLLCNSREEVLASFAGEAPKDPPAA